MIMHSTYDICSAWDLGIIIFNKFKLDTCHLLSRKLICIYVGLFVPVVHTAIKCTHVQCMIHSAQNKYLKLVSCLLVMEAMALHITAYRSLPN